MVSLRTRHSQVLHRAYPVPIHSHRGLLAHILPLRWDRDSHLLLNSRRQMVKVHRQWGHKLLAGLILFNKRRDPALNKHWPKRSRLLCLVHKPSDKVRPLHPTIRVKPTRASHQDPVPMRSHKRHNSKGCSHHQDSSKCLKPVPTTFQLPLLNRKHRGRRLLHHRSLNLLPQRRHLRLRLRHLSPQDRSLLLQASPSNNRLRRDQPFNPRLEPLSKSNLLSSQPQHLHRHIHRRLPFNQLRNLQHCRHQRLHHRLSNKFLILALRLLHLLLRLNNKLWHPDLPSSRLLHKPLRPRQHRHLHHLLLKPPRPRQHLWHRLLLQIPTHMAA